MENTQGGFDRANGQGQNHDTQGNIENVNNDTLGENTGTDDLSKGSEPNVQDNPDDTRVETVVPDNDSGDPGPSTEQGSTDENSSNKGQGPAVENL
jgi:hypothetical protein